MQLKPILQKMVEVKASDLFITPGVPPCLKVHGKLHALSKDKMLPDAVDNILDSIMSPDQKLEFENTNECCFAHQEAALGRFRVSVFVQRSQRGCVIRRIETDIPSFDNLDYPNVIQNLALSKRGLILIVGATGTGKSTTMAAMLGLRNKKTTGHIITIEDPVEFLHQHGSCIVTQREVGIDTESFDVALRSAMRQAPDVIQIGEIRDLVTMEHAITFADTGHLCLATLHATNANQALERISNFFPSDVREQVWMDLSLNLRAVIAQQLIPTKCGKNRVVAMEVLVNTPVIADLIRKGKIHLIKEFMGKKNDYGMQTFDLSLFRLYSQGKITAEDALNHADSANNVRLMIKLHKENVGELQSDADESNAPRTEQSNSPLGKDISLVDKENKKF